MPRVKDLMTSNVSVIDPDKTAVEAAKIMAAGEIEGCIVVVQSDGTPVAVLTESDFLKGVVAKDLLPSDVRVRDMMSSPLVTIGPDESVRQAARLMLEKKIRRLPVVKDGKLIGMITSVAMARHIGRKSIAEEILDALARSADSYAVTVS